MSRRDTKTASTSGKVLSPRGGSGRPKTSPKELSSPRRLVSRKELERSATELEITKKETQPKSAHAVSIGIYALAFLKSPDPTHSPLDSHSYSHLVQASGCWSTWKKIGMVDSFSHQSPLVLHICSQSRTYSHTMAQLLEARLS